MSAPSRTAGRFGPDSLGFTYAEVLVAIALVAAVLVPMLDAISVGLTGTQVHREGVKARYSVQSLSETILAKNFQELDAEAVRLSDPSVPSAFSDPVGVIPRRLVHLSRYDADNADADANPFTGTDPGLIWVQVSIEGSVESIQTLVGRD